MLIVANRSIRMLCLAAAAFSAACGGGDDPAVSGSGIAGGTIEGRSNPSFIVVRSDGSDATHLFYGPDLASTSLVTGFIFAHGGYTDYGDGVRYNASDSAQGSASLQIAVDPVAPSVVGSLRYRGDTTIHRVTGGPVPGSTYRYDRPASVDDVLGDWSLTDLGGNRVSLAVGPDGGFSGSYQGCAVTGRLIPVAGDANRFDMLASLAGCPRSRSLPFTGFGVAFPLTAGGMQLLIYATDEATWDVDTILAIGRR